MERFTAVVIGGGATGVGIFRDLCMRGVKTLLVEQKDLAYGTSSRFHGLLHSGGRYAVKDPEAAKECIEENMLLRKMAKHCIEETEGLFVRLPEDDEGFEQQWVAACQKSGIEAIEISQEARLFEPQLTSRIVSAYRVPDSAIDGFRLVWQNVASARRYGGELKTYTQVIGIEVTNNQVVGIKLKNTFTGLLESIECDYIVNAAGSWVAEITGLAGINANVQPDRGALLAFNHRFTSRIINRLRAPSDGDIFVPHGSVTILGTTSSPAKSPDDTIVTTEEVVKLLDIGEALYENLRSYRILRAFAGTRPLYSDNPAAAGRAASRNFTIIDHRIDGLEGMATIVGGKLTTYRLMAEKMTDLVCDRLNITAPCLTRAEALYDSPKDTTIEECRKVFPAYSLDRAISRLGSNLDKVLESIQADRSKQQLVCECEMVTLAEMEAAAKDSTSFSMEDVRRKTRMGEPVKEPFVAFGE